MVIGSRARLLSRNSLFLQIIRRIEVIENKTFIIKDGTHIDMTRTLLKLQSPYTAMHFLPPLVRNYNRQRC